MQWILDLNELLCKRSPRYNWTILFRPVEIEQNLDLTKSSL